MTYGGDLQQAARVRDSDVLAGKYRVDRVLGAGGMKWRISDRRALAREAAALTMGGVLR